MSSPLPAPPPRRRGSGRARFAALAVLASTVVVLGGVALVDLGDEPARGAQAGIQGGPQGRVPQFVVTCGYSHSAPDDPIVHPGFPGRSHLHDFFGNTTADASSTTPSLLGGPTTCEHRGDTASYWAPALLDHGVPVVPQGADAYYRPGPGVDPSSLEPYPEGLKVVAGDPTASSPQPTSQVGWACGASTALTAEPPECSPEAPLRVKVVFPDCWNGVDLDVPDHQSHMAPSQGGRCPSTHPVAVPQLTFVVRYPISGTGHDLTLASGTTHSVHADFFNAWDADALADEVTLCLHRELVCGVVSSRADDAARPA